MEAWHLRNPALFVENLTLTQEGTLSAGLILRERVSYVEQ